MQHKWLPVAKNVLYLRPYRNLLLGSTFLLVLYGLYLAKRYSGFNFSWRPVQVSTPPTLWIKRAGLVKEAFLHAYHSYERYATPGDELLPLSQSRIDNLNGWGLTAFDSLDTMLLFGLETEYQRALEIVKQANFSASSNTYVPYFETVIRYVGGLLSAYALSQDHILLDRVDELASRLEPVFNRSSGLAFYGVHPMNGSHSGSEYGYLAEFATLQLEYSYLAKVTGKKNYLARARNLLQVLESTDVSQSGGMFPTEWNLEIAQPHTYRQSVGAQADSAHEYLLKQYLLTSRTDKKSLEMYIRTTNFIINHLLLLSPNRHLLYVTDSMSHSTCGDSHFPTGRFEHLSCFLPGLLALGAHTLPLDSLETLGVKSSISSFNYTSLCGSAGADQKILHDYTLTQLHLWAAEGLAQTCWLMYADQPTGLGPDEVMMTGLSNRGSYLWIDAVKKWKESGGHGVIPGLGDKKPVIYTEAERLTGKGEGRDYVIRKPEYLLRPETVESLYIMWRVTGDEKWRIRGWEIFEAIEREAKVADGYASLRTVETLPSVRKDEMPSYFLAETLKYLYLLFSEDDLVPLDKWVFNTEAHPFPVFQWTAEEEKSFFGVGRGGNY